MHPLDILFWASLMLGGGYMAITLMMGGISHAAGHLHHGGAAPHGHLPHVPHAHGGHGTHALPSAHHAHAPAVHGDAGAHGQGHHGHGHGHGQDTHGVAEDGGVNLLQYLNPMFLACFFFGFGGLGTLCRFMAFPPVASALWAAAGGLGLYAFAYLFVGKIFGAGEATSHNLREAVVGLRAQVTAPIEGSRPGMVAYTVSGARQSLRAITDDDEPIPTGATVRIRKIEENTALVMRIDS